MADELGDLYGKISLTDGEKTGIQVDEGDIADGREVGGKCLIGKVWTEKNVNKEAFKSVFSTIWRTVGAVKFKELRDNIWLFEFADENDKRRVMEGRPWSFDKQIVVLNDFDGSTKPSQMDFTRSPFWIQVQDMPLLCMNKNVGTKIGESLGQLEDVDVAGDGTGWGSCLWLRVTLDLMKPLDRGRALNLAGKTSWVEFKYEKLPLFCFRCGCILHRPRGCPVPPSSRLNATENPKQWGSWLRAMDPKRRSTKGGDSYRGTAARTTTEEEEGLEADGQTVGGFPVKATPGSSGNPINGANEITPARSEESGNMESDRGEREEVRKESRSFHLSGCEETALKEKNEESLKGRSTGLIKGGQIMGFMQEGQLGLIDEDVGLEGEEGMETTNMEFSFTGEDVNSKDGHAAVSRPTRPPNLKTWKRRARRGEQVEETLVSKKKTKRVRKDSPENLVEESEKSRKRWKQIGEEYGGDEGLMAVAVQAQ
jgi:hypothetical protein